MVRTQVPTASVILGRERPGYMDRIWTELFDQNEHGQPLSRPASELKLVAAGSKT